MLRNRARVYSCRKRTQINAGFSPCCASVGNLLGRWGVDVATAIHYYEAILATLAILVWHFYQVFFDPDVYPMNGAWWDGKMPLDHYREEHGLDQETLGESGHKTSGEAPAD